MEGNSRSISVNEEIKVSKLKVKAGTMLYDGRIILIYESMHQKDDEPKQKKLKSTEVGIVKKILVKEGDIVAAGSIIAELEKKCSHPTVIKDLCAECGADLQKENAKEGGQVSTASVSMVHMVPELKVDQEHAQILGKADMNRLLEQKKLVLLVDLDQTLIHTTNDNIPNNIKDVYHFQLYGPQSTWYHTRLRPGTHEFLKTVSEKYELHICTFGSRRYAHTITRFLDPDGKLFSHRILSRDECFDPNSKTANLKALFPCGEQMVCIIDDREDVWDHASNLIHVKPYHFFQHTGDIHAPPGLTKCENDDEKQGYDFSQLNENQTNDAEKSDTDEKAGDPEENKTENGEEGVKSSDDVVDHPVNQNQNGESTVDDKSTGDLDKQNDEAPITDVEMKDLDSESDKPLVMDVSPDEPVLNSDKLVNSDGLAHEANSKLDTASITDTVLPNDENIESAEIQPTEVVMENKEDSKPDKTMDTETVLESNETAETEVILENKNPTSDEIPVIDVVETTEESKPDETPVSENALETPEESKPDETPVSENALETPEESKPDETPASENALESNENSKPDESTVGNSTPTEPATEITPPEETPNVPEPGEPIPEKDSTDAPDLSNKPPEPSSKPPFEPAPEGVQVPATIPKPLLDEHGFVIIEETDDYLLYLEEILKTIHAEFFKRLEATSIIPDLKELIPEVRAKVLEGVSIVFSGIISNKVQLEKSSAYKIARSLGAKVTQNIENSTTHLVALRSGTAKVHAAYRRRNLKLVTPEWLWTCAERWEKVDERMFPLRNAVFNNESRKPPDHCRSPEHPEPLPYQITNNVNSNQAAGFMYSFNPLMSLSSEDIESMAGEVEDIFKESDGEADGADDAFRSDDEDDSNDATQVNAGRKRKMENESSSSSQEEDESRFEKFSKIRKRKRRKQVEDDFDFDKTLDDDEDGEDDEDEKEGEDSDDDDDDTISTRFRRGEKLPSDLDIDYNTEEGTEEERESDGEWNVMGAALEREFLEGE
ncbi:RNA polymerase II subunit A C-terminal domain phosphatase [Planococcus citri]|uniref:RNA polymerase II subunit A C-terminal domain phosphatase n=1 Tax=Planococcus citri TaxID=170843 RepID=UPI0031F75776